MDSPGDKYAPGHATPEIARLIEQAGWFADLTEQLFRHAGMRPGMRVLDVGCGVGDVSFLAAGLVGAEGSVIGVDSAPDAIGVASARAAEAGPEQRAVRRERYREFCRRRPRR
jgi:ubiquinone/menaquinone biosynthesis C-methylase UbiE